MGFRRVDYWLACCVGFPLAHPPLQEETNHVTVRSWGMLYVH